MNALNRNWLRAFVRAEVFSPKWFLSRAILITLFYVVCHLAGLRENATFLSGTSTSAATSLDWSAILGVTYMAAYFGFVLAAPIFVIAAILLQGQQWVLLSRRQSGPGTDHQRNFKD